MGCGGSSELRSVDKSTLAGQTPKAEFGPIVEPSVRLSHDEKDLTQPTAEEGSENCPSLTSTTPSLTDSQDIPTFFKLIQDPSDESSSTQEYDDDLLVIPPTLVRAEQLAQEQLARDKILKKFLNYELLDGTGFACHFISSHHSESNNSVVT